MGRINNSFGFDKKRTQKLGKFYNSIDFEIKSDYSVDEFRDNPNKPVVGSFEIGNKRFPLTFSELNLIEQTVREAKEAVNKGYSLGLSGR